MELVVTLQFGTSVLLLLLSLTVSSHSFQCDKASDICGCVFTENGTQYMISMSGVNHQNGTPYFSNVGNPGSIWKYDFNPCTPFSAEGCKEVTGCQFSSDNEHFAISTTEILSFGDYSRGQPLVVKYKPTKKGRAAIVSLVYGKIEGKMKVEDPAQGKKTFAITITSKHVGPQLYKPIQPPKKSGGGPSTGSILVIIFFVLLTVYFVAGILFMKYKRGATGKEVIPNVEFWSSLPGLVKDGCVFFGSKMKLLCQRACQRGSYDEI